MTLKEKIQLPLYKGDSVAVSVDQQQHLSVLNISEPMADFFGVNSAHPLENPTYFTNAVELWAQLIIPFAMIFAGFI
jgi:K+-transporting ATPase ATPase A chain